MMFPKIQAFPIYWENGMKLSADHFQHLEDSIEDAVRDNRALGLTAMGGYGLLPYSPFELQTAQGTAPKSIRVILNACRAILPGGFRVEIIPENVQQLQLPLQFPFVEFVPTAGVRYHLFLAVSEQKRIPSGIPQTRPIRHSNLAPDYYLECVPQDRLSAVQKLTPNRMKIGELQDGKILSNYIPPSLTVIGYPILDKWHQYFQKQLENISRLGVQVVRENRVKDPAKAEFCKSLIEYIRSSHGYFNWVMPHQSPLLLAGYFGDLAGLVEALMETADRDFVRNQLQEGQINGLRSHVLELMKFRAVPLEEMALVISYTQKFVEALVQTIQSLLQKAPPSIRTGDRMVG